MHRLAKAYHYIGISNTKAYAFPSLGGEKEIYPKIGIWNLVEGEIFLKLADKPKIKVHHKRISRHLWGINTEKVDIELLKEFEKVYQLRNRTFTGCLRTYKQKEVPDFNLSMGNLFKIFNNEFLHNLLF